MILDHLAFAVAMQEFNAHRRGVHLVVLERPPAVAYQHVGEAEVCLRYGDVLHVWVEQRHVVNTVAHRLVVSTETIKFGRRYLDEIDAFVKVEFGPGSHDGFRDVVHVLRWHAAIARPETYLVQRHPDETKNPTLFDFPCQVFFPHRN